MARICGESDGLPLAIELAAARVRMLSVEQIAAGLSDRFRLLTGGPRTATERQQSLRASVDLSHDLLSHDGRGLLRRLAVFAGGFTLGAAEETCGGGRVDRDRVLELARVAGRTFAGDRRAAGCGLERPAAADEQGSLRGRHRDFFLELAEQAAPHLETARQRKWLERLDPEAANLAAATDSV